MLRAVLVSRGPNWALVAVVLGIGAEAILLVAERNSLYIISETETKGSHYGLPMVASSARATLDLLAELRKVLAEAKRDAV